MRYDGGMALPSWLPDEETKPAPMPLLVVQCFVNTWEAETGTDLLTDAPSAWAWLRAAGLLGGPEIEELDLDALRTAREAIRALLVHNGGGGPPDSGPGTLGVLAEQCRLRPEVLADGRVELRPAEEARNGALARLLTIVRDAQHDGTWQRLKACRNPDCTWAYYDRSHAARGAWCDMAVCGNRIKNRNLRSRRSGDGGVVPAVHVAGSR